jgi:hypothetical protein
MSPTQGFQQKTFGKKKLAKNIRQNLVRLEVIYLSAISKKLFFVH